MTDPKLTGSVQEAAEVLGVSAPLVRRLIKAGVIPCIEFGTSNRKRVAWQPFLAWIDSHKPTGQDAA